VSKLNNVNVKHLKIPKKHRGPYAARVFETPGISSKYWLGAMSSSGRDTNETRPMKKI